MTESSFNLQDVCDNVSIRDIINYGANMTTEQLIESLQEKEQEKNTREGQINNSGESEDDGSDSETNKKLARIRKFDEKFQLKYRGDKDYSKRHAVEQRKRPLKKRKVCKTKKREKERKKEGTIDI